MDIGTRTHISSDIFPRAKTSAAYQLGQITSFDGTQIGYRQIGSGPGLLVLHDGVRASQHYLRLAEALADQYTVTIPDRRGRGLSGPRGDEYNLQTELEDLNVLMRRTGSRILFGHSAGGYFALEAALQLPVEKLVLFEPAVLMGAPFPLDWLTIFEEAVDRKDSVTAMMILLKGLGVNWSGELSSHRDTVPSQEADLYRLTFARYPQIEAETLLLGGKSSPVYLREVLSVLARILPRARTIELTGLDHTAPVVTAPNTIAAEMMRFLE
jgi:pimeloyl-ACP methyl ester carboxylesterase